MEPKLNSIVSPLYSTTIMVDMISQIMLEVWARFNGTHQVY